MLESLKNEVERVLWPVVVSAEVERSRPVINVLAVCVSDKETRPARKPLVGFDLQRMIVAVAYSKLAINLAQLRRDSTAAIEIANSVRQLCAHRTDIACF